MAKMLSNEDLEYISSYTAISKDEVKEQFENFLKGKDEGLEDVDLHKVMQENIERVWMTAANIFYWGYCRILLWKGLLYNP